MCRNQERGEAAKQEISSESSNEVSSDVHYLSLSHCVSLFLWQKIYLHLLDLSKPKDVTKFTQDFIQSGQQLDVLVGQSVHGDVICHVTCHVTR